VAKKCPSCGKTLKKGKKVPEYERNLRDAFPKEYEERGVSSPLKMDMVEEIKILTQGIADLMHSRDNLYSKIRNNNISQQAVDFFGTARKYSVIVADVPWNYPNQHFNGGIKDKYSQMKDEEIYALPVEGLCRENAVLLFWATYPKLQIALNTIYAWGFRYTTCFLAWSKLYPKSFELCSGGGCYTRPNTEVCLLGIKGEMSKFRMRNTCISNALVTQPEQNPLFFEKEEIKPGNKRLLGHHEEDEENFWETVNLTSPLFTARKEHSEKPDESYEKIIQIFGDLPRYDMFARKRRFGWDSFGNQLDMFPPDCPFDPEVDRMWKERQDRNVEFQENFMPELSDRWEKRETADIAFTPSF
jgi:N6-adenosine-specific RNA methylase IME4